LVGGLGVGVGGVVCVGFDRRAGRAVPATVQRLVVGEGLGLVGIGIVLGLGGALAATRVLRTFLFDLTPSDPITYVGIVVVLVIAAVLASWIPGRRAARVDPMIALRAE
jgi:putative ABC transport system permease protein